MFQSVEQAMLRPHVRIQWEREVDGRGHKLPQRGLEVVLNRDRRATDGFREDLRLLIDIPDGVLHDRESHIVHLLFDQ